MPSRTAALAALAAALAAAGAGRAHGAQLDATVGPARGGAEFGMGYAPAAHRVRRGGRGGRRA